MSFFAKCDIADANNARNRTQSTGFPLWTRGVTRSLKKNKKTKTKKEASFFFFNRIHPVLVVYILPRFFKIRTPHEAILNIYIEQVSNIPYLKLKKKNNVELLLFLLSKVSVLKEP